MSSATKTVVFLGASVGVGHYALKNTLAAGHDCIAICRTPSKLTDLISPESHPNLRVVQGNAHDVAAITPCLTKPDGTLVDTIVSTIGTKPALRKMTTEELEVCRRGMAALLQALADVRSNGATGKPLIVVCSTTGMSRFGRDTPLVVAPLYNIFLKVPHQDKKIMEDKLVDSGEEFAIVRASLLTNGATDKTVRVGIEDPKKGRESEAIGYAISREDAGKWFAENLIMNKEPKYVNKIMMITT